MELTEKQMKLVEKLKKKMPDFVEEVERLSTAEMEDRIVRYMAEISEAEAALESNQAYQLLKEQVKQIAEPLREAKTAYTDRMKYLLIAIEEKGGSPNTLMQRALK